MVIAAKSAEALRVMNDKIRSREILKYYLCITLGRPTPAEGTLSGYLFKDESKKQVFVRRVPSPGAKTAITHYKTLLSRGALSLVECELMTGRTHQIRAQFAAAGHPLLGDGKYGRGILNNCKIKIILNLEEEEAQRVQSVLKLTDAEIDNITRFERGSALIVTNSNNVTVDMRCSEEEKDLITTDRDELRRIVERKMQNQTETEES